MGLLVRQSFDSRFVDKLKKLSDEYGDIILELDGIGPSQLDINNFSERFFSKKNIAEVSADANANVDDDSVLSFEYEFSKSIQKLNGYYVIWKKIVDKYGIKKANSVLDKCILGALKIHDQHLIMKPYCYAFSLYELAAKGLPFVKKVHITPAKHLTSFIDHVIQFTAYASNQLAGAAGFPDFFVYMDWYARKDYGDNYLDNLEYRKIITQALQSLIYSWNWPYRGSQSAFVNVNLYDDYFLKDLFENSYYPDNSQPNLESIKKLQEFYMRWFIKESETQTFTFPINTVTFYKDNNGDILDIKFLDLVSELNCFNGTFNIFTGPLGVLSSCCRLRNDANKTSYTNSFGAGGISIGSHRVVTLNLPHIAYAAEDDDIFFKELEKNVRDAHVILDAQYDILVDNIKHNKLPLYTHQFMYLQKQFSTIGFIGINEACELQKYDILTDQGIAFCTKTLNLMAKIGEQLSQQDGRIRNLEQIPGESAAVSLAQKDKIIFHNHKYDMYANQYIPLWKNVDIHDRIRIQGKFDNLCSGGAICHLNSSDSLTPNQMKTLIVTAAKAGCIYYAVNMTLARCNICQKLYIGKFEKSPCHNADMTRYMRVVGFLTPVENWIPQRKIEYTKRQIYNKENFN